MIRKFSIALISLGLVHTMSAQDSLCIELMRPEARVVGLFQSIDQFHHGLMFECREPRKAPYAQMDSLHHWMMDFQSHVISQRGKGCMRIDSLRKVKEVKGVGLEKAFEFFKGGLEIKADHFQSRWDVYDSLRTAHGIQMISHREYGDSLMDRLMAWQDTLVAQGSTISQCNQALKASGLDSRSDEYRSRYQPISQMQLIHKQFQAKLLQVENQQSRYASARQDEVFYLGPYLVERHDVMASERFFDELREFQGEFNALLREFRILNS